MLPRIQLHPALAVSRIRSRRTVSTQIVTRSWRFLEHGLSNLRWRWRSHALEWELSQDISSQCTARGLSGTNLATCQQLLSAVPAYSLQPEQDGLSTLQFQSLSVAADNPKHLQGGTQDNGTFETTGFDCGVATDHIWRRRSIRLQRWATPRFAFQLVHVKFPRCELPEWRPSEVGHREWADRSQRRRCAVLRAHHCRS